jgi:hypothetical protein
LDAAKALMDRVKARTNRVALASLRVIVHLLGS